MARPMRRWQRLRTRALPVNQGCGRWRVLESARGWSLNWPPMGGPISDSTLLRRLQTLELRAREEKIDAANRYRADFFETPAEERANAYETSLAFGTFKLNGQEGTKVEASSIPNWVKTNLVRAVTKLDGIKSCKRICPLSEAMRAIRLSGIEMGSGEVDCDLAVRYEPTFLRTKRAADADLNCRYS
jgi:hypothetical protein